MAKPKLDIVIPAAGLGRRMKSFGPKPLVGIGQETLLGRQLRLLGSAYPNARFVVVVGHESDRVRKTIPHGVKVVVNREYETTNVGWSIALGLAATNKNRPALVVYGDLVFNKRAVQGIPLNASSILVNRDPARPEEVGVNVDGGKVMHFSYGLNLKWSQITMLAPREKLLFVAAAHRPEAVRYFGYEILNLVLDAGGSFNALADPTGLSEVLEVDTAADLEAARKIDRTGVDKTDYYEILST